MFSFLKTDFQFFSLFLTSLIILSFALFKLCSEFSRVSFGRSLFNFQDSVSLKSFLLSQASLARQLIYHITSFWVCQVLFSTFFKFFFDVSLKLFSSRFLFFLSVRMSLSERTFISYHIQLLLSSLFLLLDNCTAPWHFLSNFVSKVHNKEVLSLSIILALYLFL